MRFEGIVEKFPGLCVAEGVVHGLSIGGKSEDLERLRMEIVGRIRSSYTLENVKDDPGFRAYRDFFWGVGVDPTKTRPASEALVRRVLAGKSLPVINAAVDAYNLASASNGVPIAAFDDNLLCGVLTMRFARDGETFLGIGMEKRAVLKTNQVVIADEGDRIVAIYPYRDSDDTRVTSSTRDIRLVSCGVPGVSRSKVLDAYRSCADYMKRYCGGSSDDPSLYP
ncbi:MAG TPA: phenylalanine--tRNA ligase beta subunit-related protein [Methanocella sp.]|nr:phenylalanine--tRNA ligase beta subunit-related protein [Methanocella sp.]